MLLFYFRIIEVPKKCLQNEKNNVSAGREERNFFSPRPRQPCTLHDKLILLWPYSFRDRRLIVD